MLACLKITTQGEAGLRQGSLENLKWKEKNLSRLQYIRSEGELLLWDTAAYWVRQGWKILIWRGGELKGTMLVIRERIFVVRMASLFTHIIFIILYLIFVFVKRQLRDKYCRFIVSLRGLSSVISWWCSLISVGPGQP